MGGAGVGEFFFFFFFWGGGGGRGARLSDFFFASDLQF